MRRTSLVLLAMVLLAGTPFDAAKSIADEHGEQKSVLVTGASSGIGRRIAEALAEHGHFVYAGARKPSDIAALSEIDNVKGVRLDVTIQSDIDAVVDEIRNDRRSLYGLVNNAGVAVFGPLLQVADSRDYRSS